MELRNLIKSLIQQDLNQWKVNVHMSYTLAETLKKTFKLITCSIQKQIQGQKNNNKVKKSRTTAPETYEIMRSLKINFTT